MFITRHVDRPTSNFTNCSWSHDPFSRHMASKSWWIQGLFLYISTRCSGYIQASRALMIASIVLGTFGLVAGLIGAQCSKAGGENYLLKGRIAGTAGVFFILQGNKDKKKLQWKKVKTREGKPVRLSPKWRKVFDQSQQQWLPNTLLCKQIRNFSKLLINDYHVLLRIQINPL